MVVSDVPARCTAVRCRAVMRYLSSVGLKSRRAALSRTLTALSRRRLSD
jgi:hypothetical protein